MTEHPDDGAGPLPLGHVVASRYTLEEVLGQGRFGWLYRAADCQRDEPMVLYVLAEKATGPGGPLEFKLWLAAIHRRGSQDILDYETVDGLTLVTLRYTPRGRDRVQGHEGPSSEGTWREIHSP